MKLHLGGVAQVHVALICAEHMFIMVRRFAPAEEVKQDHLQSFHKAIVDAGGFSSEMEGVLDTIELAHSGHIIE